ncbi:innate immunity activator protein isoform X1 [Callorhinchus milii]|uniref:innate immunity activator protein isoform X1 n=1 Tax=Callorhinchus milii TaxID=7868 RepID=UPI0004574F0F|nr:innate immunity activator protein isoform X1 [Callorhinchus milii]|eukprot:gi/632953467/ref/XP_007892434.1/ PREDICTED: uncharacterized protein C1orf106 homolog isoform X1 [Callorhinchus milii]
MLAGESNPTWNNLLGLRKSGPLHALTLKMESKDEASDSDSGVILQSGSDSPQSLMKDLHCSVISRQQMLEETLEAYLKELKKLCLREAELTGKLPKEYPLAEGEEPPIVRRRIGTTFKLDEKIVPEGEDSELSSLERDFALQLQFVEAAKRLSQEDNLTRQIRKQRKNIFTKEQKKLKDIKQTLKEYRIKGVGSPLQLNNVLEELSASDDSSLSDAAVLEDDDVRLQGPHSSVEHLSTVQLPQNRGSPIPSLPPFRPLPPQHLEGIAQHCYRNSDYERSPIANKAWKESSLDEPYEKEKRSSSSSSKSSSPSVTPSESLMGDFPMFPHYSMRSFAYQNHNSSSAPPTPDLRGRNYHQTRYVDANQLQAPSEQRGRSLLPQRRPSNYTVFVPDCYSTRNKPIDSPQFVSCSMSGYPSSESNSSGISTLNYAPMPHEYDPGAPRYWQMYNCPAGTGRYVTQLRNDDGFYHDPTPSFHYYRAVEHPDVNAMAHMWGGAPKPQYITTQQLQHPLYRDCRYNDENASLQVQRITPSHCRIVRTPSLKEYPNRGLIREVVSEELKSWHERSRRRNGRPHSLDRRDAIRVPHGQSRGREHYIRWPVRPVQRHLSQNAPDHPQQRKWYMTEESEVASQF